MLNTNYTKEKEKLQKLLNNAVKNCKEKATALLEWRDNKVALDELYSERTKQEYIKSELEFWKQEELNLQRMYNQALLDLNRRYNVA